MGKCPAHVQKNTFQDLCGFRPSPTLRGTSSRLSPVLGRPLLPSDCSADTLTPWWVSAAQGRLARACRVLLPGMVTVSAPSPGSGPTNPTGERRGLAAAPASRAAPRGSSPSSASPRRAPRRSVPVLPLARVPVLPLARPGARARVPAASPRPPALRAHDHRPKPLVTHHLSPVVRASAAGSASTETTPSGAEVTKKKLRKPVRSNSLPGELRAEGSSQLFS